MLSQLIHEPQCISALGLIYSCLEISLPSGPLYPGKWFSHRIIEEEFWIGFWSTFLLHIFPEKTFWCRRYFQSCLSGGFGATGINWLRRLSASKLSLHLSGPFQQASIRATITIRVSIWMSPEFRPNWHWIYWPISSFMCLSLVSVPPSPDFAVMSP